MNTVIRPPQNKTVRYVVLALLTVSMTLTTIITFSVTRDFLTARLNDDTPTGSVARVFQPPQRVPDFTLTSHRNEPISLSDFRGDVTVLFFGYTHCPDVCPTTLADFRQAKQALGDDADDVRFVFISVDGERDSWIAVQEYLRHFDDDFIGMTGDPAEVRRIGEPFGLFFAYLEEYDAFGNYLVDHTASSFVIDRAGRLRLSFAHGTAPDDMAAALRRILAEDNDLRETFLFDEPRPLDDFTLTNHLGEAMRLSDLRGRPTLLFFGYTHCPDICPTTLSEFTVVKRELGTAADDVNFVFVSVDGERDTPAVIADYIGQFDADFIGMTGVPDDVRAIGEDFNLFFEYQRADVNGDYLVDHSASSFLIGADGQFYGAFPYQTLPEDIAATLRILLDS